MQNQERDETVKQLAALALESDVKEPIDWSKMEITKEQAFLMMANNVVDQLETVNEEHRSTVAMATITKLLVENFVLNFKLHGENNESKQS